MRNYLSAAALALAASTMAAAPAMAQEQEPEPKKESSTKRILGRVLQAVLGPEEEEQQAEVATEVTAELTPLQRVLADERRAEDRARDQWRHPAETLAFFQVEQDMKVGEFGPGSGWYSRVLAPYLAERGRLVGIYADPTLASSDAERQQRIRNAAATFPGKAAEWTGQPAWRFGGMTLENVPETEAGTFDRILLIRALHGQMRDNIADSHIRALRSLLKDDGMIGIVQHRANADAPFAYASGSRGYLREADVIAFMQVHGFELVGSSEINANPADPANHEGGVWEIPPVWNSKDDAKKAIGESDRMTLLFKKRM